MTNEEMLAERLVTEKVDILQAITKARNAAEQAGDKKTVEKLDEIYD
jgi:hypothetical protein